MTTYVPSSFTFVAKGKAAPQGSKTLGRRKNGSTFMKEASDRVKPWRTWVKRATLGSDGLARWKYSGAVRVDIGFEFRRPKSNTDNHPTARHFGDLDKLSRAVLDALVMAGVIPDDSMVVELQADKVFGDEDRVIITVTPIVSKPSVAENPFWEGSCMCGDAYCVECQTR